MLLKIFKKSTVIATSIFLIQPFLFAMSKDIVFKTKDVVWTHAEPKKDCEILIHSPKFILEGEGRAAKISFKFHNLDYTAPNISDDAKNFKFQMAYDSDHGTESVTIIIDGVISNGEFIGRADLAIQRDVSIPKEKGKLFQHKYNCKVTYSFSGKIIESK